MREINVGIDTQIKVNDGKTMIVYYEGELIVIAKNVVKRYCNILPNGDVTQVLPCTLKTDLGNIKSIFKQVGSGLFNETNIKKGLSMLKAYYRKQAKLNEINGGFKNEKN